MALLGQGADNFIVTERPDGSNVDAWHWVERDCMSWSRKRLGELLSDTLVVENASQRVRLVGAPKVEGEAFLNTRKRKLIPSYELSVSIDWEGETLDADGAVIETAKGVVKLPYVAEENRGEDPEVNVSTKDTSKAADALRSSLLSHGKPAVFSAIATFVEEFHTGVPAGKDAVAAAAADKQPAAAAETKGAPPATTADAAPPAPPPAAATPAKQTEGGKSVYIKEEYFCSAHDLYECFVNSDRMKAYCRADCSATPEVGGEWSMYSGAVGGTFLELEPDKRIVQTWRTPSWPEGHLSKVELTITEPTEGKAVLVIDHTDIPYEDKHGNHDMQGNVQQGWQGQVLQRIRGVFGYGI